MVYDAAGRRLIVYGGTSNEEQTLLLEDTWAYDPAVNAWTELSQGRSARTEAATAYDQSTARMLLFGGNGIRTFGDTWAYTP